MNRELSKDRSRARKILAAEIFNTVKTRLEKSGFEVVAEDGSLHKVGLHGQFFASLHCIPTVSSTVCLSVWVKELYHPVTGVANFTKDFRLHGTESPRRSAALIVKFLHKAIVKLIHQA